MENDTLKNIWSIQGKDFTPSPAKDIINKAKKQRQGQYIGIGVMGITVLILVAYSIYFATTFWNNFTLGLVLMISSLLFRIVLEVITVYKKENRLIEMDSKSYHSYLKKHYRLRLIINYYITPLCFIIYAYGFYLLLPFFKREFSNGFYNYLLVSGILSILVVLGIVINSVVKERRFFKELSNH
jgi:hypothetical protein